MNPDEKTYTIRDIVLAKREAYIGCTLEHSDWWGQTEKERANRRAEELYPLPKLLRLRAVTDPISDDYEWSVRGGAMYFRWKLAGEHEWKRAASTGQQNMLLDVCPARVKVWADLFANPTEEVEEDA